MAMLADLSREERVGLGAAVVAHLALAAGLAFHATREPPPYTPTERIDVNLASEISLESTAPDPSAEPAAATAPEIADTPLAPEDMVEAPPAEPVERPVTAPPRRTTEPRTPSPQPSPQPTRRAEQTPTPRPTATATQRAQGSRLSEDFLQGSSSAQGNSGSPAANFGPTERAALASAITRQLRPHWSAPSGVDVEQLVSVVSWQLNRDGSLKDRPRCLSQRGINDSNRPQASLHCERAIRAVQLAAPFNLPDQFYSRWNDLEWDFDRRL
ncbi:cell envelope integrity protein TolA [Aurantiacibacter hainanensis]|uniref:cell envelope integrity protein TolA n=1 Tax=Aurantiacibacter hainanensis TaxID=3076114 RepID=UPI0030C6B913